MTVDMDGEIRFYYLRPHCCYSQWEHCHCSQSDRICRVSHSLSWTLLLKVPLLNHQIQCLTANSCCQHREEVDFRRKIKLTAKLLVPNIRENLMSTIA